MRRRIVIIGLVYVVAFVSGGWLLQSRPQQQSASVYQKARLFDDILAHVAEYYVDSLDQAKLYDMAIEGMLDQLNDPYTAYLGLEAVQELRLTTTGNYGGVGVQIDSRDGYITVVTPLPDTPGERAGLLSGDQIVAVDGASTFEWTVDKAASHMKGEPGTHVHLKVVRAGNTDTLRVDIERARIHLNPVEGAMLLRPGVGYVRLNSVSASATRDLDTAIVNLRKQGARSLILDLRTNPGGILQQGVELADLFLDSNATVVETRGRAPGESETFRDDRKQLWPEMPLVVLVNPATASAAEILSGALQDHDRALVVGTRTFGKGVAYRVFPLSQNEAVSVTTARWYTPNGRSIDRPRTRRGTPVEDGQRPIGEGAADSAGLIASDSKTVYRSDAGRALQGGGGIHPDIVVRPDTLTTPEQQMVRLLGAKLGTYNDARSRYALDLKASGTITDPAFRITDAHIAELLKRLRARGVEMPDSVWNGARNVVSEQLGYDVARFVFGRAAELRRRAEADNQISYAVDLLVRARTMADLFRAAKGAGGSPGQ